MTALQNQNLWLKTSVWQKNLHEIFKSHNYKISRLNKFGRKNSKKKLLLSTLEHLIQLLNLWSLSIKWLKIWVSLRGKLYTSSNISRSKVQCTQQKPWIFIQKSKRNKSYFLDLEHSIPLKNLSILSQKFPDNWVSNKLTLNASSSILGRLVVLQWVWKDLQEGPIKNSSSVTIILTSEILIQLKRLKY